MANGVDRRINGLICPLAKARETNVKVFSTEQFFVEYYALSSSVCGISESVFGQSVAMFHEQRNGGNGPIFRSIRGLRSVFGLAD